MKIRTFIELTRMEHSIMLVLGVFVVILLADIQPSYDKLLFALACPLLISAGAFALNDYFDAESDRLNRKNRPIVRGEITKEDALKIAVLLIVLGTLIAYPLGVYPFMIAVVFALLSILYDWKLKDVALIGNIIVAASMSIIFIFTSLSFAENISSVVIYVAIISFISGLGREIQKTVQDIEGDVAARGSKTLPVFIGKSYSLHVALLLMIIASALALYLYFEIPPLKGNTLYLVPMLVSVCMFLYSSYLFYGAQKQKEMGRRISLYALILGIISYMLGGI
ncbi:MAG: UbiA family prenyltransferase [Candidatus Micrarchaeia archaeon]